jgi:hypothetical protein
MNIMTTALVLVAPKYINTNTFVFDPDEASYVIDIKWA